MIENIFKHTDLPAIMKRCINTKQNRFTGTVLIRCISLSVIISISVLSGMVYAQEKPSEALTPSGSSLTFQDAMGKMFTSSDSMIAAKLEESQRLHEKEAAFGLYFPKVEIKANGVRMSDPVVMDLSDIRTAILQVQKATLQGASVPPAQIQAVSQMTASQLPPFEKTLMEKQFASVDASVTIPLFTGGKIRAANKAAEARMDEAHQKSTDTRNRLVSELVSRYFGLRFAVKLIEVRKMVFTGMEKHLKEAKALEQNGMIARVERLHAEVAFADADREMKKAERIVTLARTVLNNCIGYSEDVNPVTPLFVVKEIQPLAYFQKSAIDNNPLLFQIAANRELAHQGYLKEIASFSPEIFAFGTKEIYGYKVPEYVPNWVVGIGATCTIFEGFAGSEKVKAARAQEERVAVLESKARKDILMLVEKNYQELMQALEQYEALITAYEFTQEYLRVREKAFAEGSATSLDVVDAELAFAKVKIDKLKAAYDFDVALASLLETSGISAQFEQYMKGTEEVEF